MFIPCPFPSTEDSLDYLSFPWIVRIAKGAIYSINHTRRATRHHLYSDWPFYLHYHFLATYGLAAIARLEPRMATGPFLTTFLPIKKQLTRDSTCIDTGPPEWWGREDIHKSHRDFLKYNTPGKKHDHGFLVLPKRDINALLTNLQPILRGHNDISR